MVNNSSRLGVPSVRYTVPDEAEAPQTDSDVRLYPGSRVAARLLSIGMLCSVFALFGSVGFSVSQALHDSFVAPTILSPDSDLVIASKLKLIELAVERARATAELEGIDSDVGADTQGLARLDELRGKLESAVQWTSEITTQKVVAGSRELKDLAQQRELVGAMVEEQRKLTENAHADVGAGVISRADYARQTQSLTEFQLALLENERSTLQSKAALLETALAQRALAGSGGAPIMPELMMNEEQSIRVELETMRLEADKRSKLAARTAVIERIDKIDELSSEMRRRPVYRAIERSLDVAFVPYTQLDGVAAGAGVYSCVWGLILCKQVGTVAEVVPGEVLVADPWGTPARGQDAILSLWDHESAKGKTLRIRGGSSSQGPSKVAGVSLARR